MMEEMPEPAIVGDDAEPRRIVEAMIVWNDRSMSRAMVEQARLLGIIDRAVAALPGERLINRLDGLRSEVATTQQALALADVIDALNEARRILAEVDPDDSEDSDDGN